MIGDKKVNKFYILEKKVLYKTVILTAYYKPINLKTMDLSMILIAIAIGALLLLFLIIILVKRNQTEVSPDKRDQPSQAMGKGMGIGIPVGIGAGIALGVAMDNIGMGIAIGAAIGTSIGVAMGAAFKKEENRNKSYFENQPIPTQNKTKNLLILGVLSVFICCLVLGLFFFMKLK